MKLLLTFSLTRRPHLLLDYYRMHGSSAEVQALFRQFLRALFGVSKETVDDLRFLEAGNRAHFCRMDPALVRAWREGSIQLDEDEVTNECSDSDAREGKDDDDDGDDDIHDDGSYSGGEEDASNEDSVGHTPHRRTRIATAILPGFNDPQTLFMVGEDSNTCMSIRARLKSTNRGLLSILLHGNCRVLGIKDSSGRLTARALVRLLIDSATGQPVSVGDSLSSFILFRYQFFNNFIFAKFNF